MMIPINWIFFFILQLIVFLIYRFDKSDHKVYALSKLFKSKLHYLIFNSAVFSICVLTNYEHQLLCIPVLWAAILLLIFALSFLSFPFIEDKKYLAPLIAFFSGSGIFIAIYLLFFGRWEYLFVLALNLPLLVGLHFLIRFLKKKYGKNYFDALYLYPLVILAPFFILYQLWLIFKNTIGIRKKLILTSPILLLILFVTLSFRINFLVSEIKTNRTNAEKIETLIDNPVDHYLMELILGAHWKYHTELCMYDGWRPPYHDPVLVVANKIFNPYSKFDQGMDWPSAQILYKQLYPNNQTEFECKCAKYELFYRY